MKKILLALSLLTITTGYSQNNTIQVFDNEKKLGKNLIDNTDIVGKEYIFSNRVDTFFLDSASTLLTLQLRDLSVNGRYLLNTGDIVQYDLKNSKVLWTDRINYHSEFVTQSKDALIYNQKNKSTMLDIYTGKKIWGASNNISYLSPNQKIGFGYEPAHLTMSPDLLFCNNIKNGFVKWHREIGRDYGWNAITHLDDTTLLITSSGLHTVNTTTGDGWDYKTKTGKNDIGKTVAANALGITVGILTGTFVIFTGHDVYYDLVSNTLYDSTHIYLASAEQLVKIDKKSGEIAWKYPFQTKTASKSSILMNDSVVFMINKGIANMNGFEVSYGVPFYAAFDKKTGKKLFLSTINTEKDPIIAFKEYDNEMFIVFKNRIEKYSTLTGERIDEKDFVKNTIGRFKYFLRDSTYWTTKGNSLMPISESNELLIYTDKDRVVSLDANLNIKNIFLAEDLSLNYLSTENYRFFAKNNKTFIADNEGKTVAEIDATSRAFLVGNTLYEKRDNKFISIDLTKILTKKD